MSTQSLTFASPKVITIEEKPLNWENFKPVHPRFMGVDSFDARVTKTISKFLDWNNFFQKWGFPPEFPNILENQEWGDVAEDLYEDVRNLYQELLDEKCLYPVALFGIWKACSVNDHVLVLKEKQPITSLYFPRLTVNGTDVSVADYIKPMYALKNNESDYIGGYAISLGEEVFNKWIKLKAEKDNYKSYLLEDFCQMYITAVADYLHHSIRQSVWSGISESDRLEQGKGIRVEIGKAECPELEACEKLFDLLDVDKEHFMVNEQFYFNSDFTICGYFFAHPQAQNFPVSETENLHQTVRQNFI
jgi:5-methyltetrahydrofolate--homocysteine methyltransferase